MTSEIAPPPPPSAAPEAPPRKSGFQRLAGVLFAPAETFRDIAARPDIVVPLVAILLISIVTSVLIVPRVDFETAVREQLSQANRNMSEADLDRMVRFSGALAKTLAYASPVLSVIIFAVVAGVLLLAFRLFGGEGGYKQAFSVTLYAWLPMILQGVIGVIILLARGAVSAEEMPHLVMSSLGFLVDMKENPVAFAFLSSLDVFTFWSLALFVIGFSALSRMSTSRSAAIVLTLWIVLIVLPKIGFAALGAARAAAA